MATKKTKTPKNKTAKKTSGEKISNEQCKKYVATCMSCMAVARKNHTFKKGTGKKYEVKISDCKLHKMKNGSYRVAGKCPKCGGTATRILGKNV